MVKIKPKIHLKNESSGKKVINDKDINPDVELLKSQLVRALADYDNLRKRAETEKALWIKFSSQRILTALLPVLDNFESAQKHIGDSGLAIAIGEFKKVFFEEGLEEVIPQVGSEFNHELYEAVETVETDDQGKDGKIAELVLPGWKYKSEDEMNEGKLVIRHAKVKVFKIEN